jgi:hypothetical protein
MSLRRSTRLIRVQYITPSIRLDVHALSEVNCNWLHGAGIPAGDRFLTRSYLRYGEHRVCF